MAENENWGGLLLFLACFLGFFAFMVGSMPIFISEGASMRGAVYPSYLSSDEIAMFSDWYNTTILSDYTTSYVLGGHDFRIGASYSSNFFHHFHYHWFLWFEVNEHSMEWYDYDGELVSSLLYDHYGITKEDMDDNYDAPTGRCEFSVRCKHTMIKVFFSFNISAYNYPSEAWQNSDLGFTSAIHFDKVGTSWNSWSLITNILFFQAPTSDFPLIIQIFIALPFWIVAGYLIYRLVLLALPFVG